MKRNKKLGAVLLSLALVIGLAPALTGRAEEEQPRAMLQVASSDTQTISYKAGETKNLGFVVTNTGNVDLKNVRIVPRVSESLDAWPFEVENRDYAHVIESLPAGGQETVEFAFTARTNVRDQYYKLPIDFTAETADETGGSIDGEYGVYVKTVAKQEEKPQENPQEKPQQTKPEEEKKDEAGNAGAGGYAMEAGGVVNTAPVSVGGSGNTSVPRVIVTGFTTSPQDVRAGTNFRLTVHLKNTSKTTAVSNLLFDLRSPTEGSDEQTAAPAFLPASGASSIYLEQIAADGTQDISLELNAKADLVQKPYSVELTMKYEDMQGGQFEGASAISIPVRQDARFEFSEFEISPETVSVGEEANVMCELYNLGRVKLYNVKAKFEGAGIKTEEVFVGNVEPGATAGIDGMVAAKKAGKGKQKMKMTLSYEDESGKVTTAEKEFQLEIAEEAPEADLAAEQMAEESGAKFPVLPVAAAVLGFLGVTAGVLIYKKKKKRRLDEEEEGLIDEFDRFIEDEHREP